MTKDEIRCVQRAAELVDEAARHHDAAVSAHDAGDDRMVARKHTDTARCLRGAQAAFKRIADMAGEQDIKNSQTIQGSDGIGIDNGSSPAGRSESPLWSGDVKGWLNSARRAR